jgi:hypothetical protein
VVWRNMMARCSNPNDSRYGGRGITVCERWQDFASFHADMGSPPSPRYTLDRIDVNGNYEHGNCRWATPTEQARNKASNRIISYQGLDLSLAAHCERVGIPYKTAHQRLQRGWAVEQALSLTT